jgi:hypothetical protein
MVAAQFEQRSGLLAYDLAMIGALVCVPDVPSSGS